MQEVTIGHKQVMAEVKRWEASHEEGRIQFSVWTKKDTAKELEKVTNLFYQGD